MAQPMTEPASSGTQALDRAVQLVSSVVQADEPLSFADLQESSGLAKSTTSRMLAALERGGLLERDDSGGYVAGSLFWLYAARHDPWEELVRLARPVMEQVGEDTQESVHLSVLRGDQGRAGRPGRLPLPARHARLDRDRRTCPHLRPRQGLPRLGRARLSPTRGSRSSRRATIASKSRLDRDCATTRGRGYATTVDELEVGLTGIAAPVRGARGDVVAAIGISGPTSRLSVRLDELGRNLTVRAAALESVLHGPTTINTKGVA